MNAFGFLATAIVSAIVSLFGVSGVLASYAGQGEVCVGRDKAVRDAVSVFLADYSREQQIWGVLAQMVMSFEEFSTNVADAVYLETTAEFYGVSEEESAQTQNDPARCVFEYFFLTTGKDLLRDTLFRAVSAEVDS